MYYNPCDTVCRWGSLFIKEAVALMLVATLDQLIEKKKQLSLKSMFEGRQQLKQKRHEEELERERNQKLEEEKRLYVSSVHAVFYFKLFCCLFMSIKELSIIF
ncbi:unnamed protein product [Lupinus luteus]|uniref:Uncharacterized protein n=1 Tax=Lupinus luteus TaxID=3873 RepID=A0AAV1YPL1_LUPLU